jgi:hypothetical protein
MPEHYQLTTAQKLRLGKLIRADLPATVKKYFRAGDRAQAKAMEAQRNGGLIELRYSVSNIETRVEELLFELEASRAGVDVICMSSPWHRVEGDYPHILNAYFSTKQFMYEIIGVDSHTQASRRLDFTALGYLDCSELDASDHQILEAKKGNSVGAYLAMQRDMLKEQLSGEALSVFEETLKKQVKMI